MSKATDHAKTMLNTYMSAYKGLPVKAQAVAIEFKRSMARIPAKRELSFEGKAIAIDAARKKRDQQTASLRQDLADAKDGVDRQLAILRRGALEEGDSKTKLIGEMQLTRAWERVKPRLLRAANSKETMFASAGNLIKEAKAAKGSVTLNALREELPAFIDAHEPAAHPSAREQILAAITGQIDAAEATLSPDFDLAHQTAPVTARGYGVIHQSLNTIEHSLPDPSNIRVFDWPDQAGKVAQ